ncbi:MAG: hypothetical protein AAF530_19015 [Pseudomonadota bacterium]
MSNPKDEQSSGLLRRQALRRALALASAPVAALTLLPGCMNRASAAGRLPNPASDENRAEIQPASLWGDPHKLPTLGQMGHSAGDAVEATLVQNEYTIITGGQFRISRDTTLTGILHFMGGGLSVDDGVTLTVKGQIIAPASQIFFGEGLVEGPCRGTDVRPEWFGAVGNGYEDDAHNDTDAIRKAVLFTRGGVLRLSGMYSLDPEVILFTHLNNGIHVVGDSGAGAKAQGNEKEDQLYHTNPTGFCLRKDGDWMIGFGDMETPRSSINDSIWEGVVFEGNGKTVHLGLLWCHLLRTSKFESCSVKSVRGAGLFVHKFEDVTWSSCQFTYLGVPKEGNKFGLHGGIIFGAPPKRGRIGTNVVYFLDHCRFEWMDGGYVNALREPVENPDYRYNDKAIPSAKHIHIVDSKMEIGAINGWGKSRGDYPVFDLAAFENRNVGRDDPPEDHHPAENWNIGPGNHLNDPHHAKWFMTLGGMDNVAIHGNSFSVYGKCDFVQFASSEVENFWCTDNGTRCKSDPEKVRFVNDFSKGAYVHYFEEIRKSMKKT